MADAAEMRALVFDTYAARWQVAHALRAVVRLQQALREGGEPMDEALARDVEIAAMGRDLYMDSAVSPETIRARFGVRVDRLIAGLSNRRMTQTEYDALTAGTVEELRLIRLASIIENVQTIGARIADFGGAWARTAILPVLQRWTHPSYERYVATAKILEHDLAWHREELVGKVAEARDDQAPGHADERAAREAWLVRGMRAFASRVALPS